MAPPEANMSQKDISANINLPKILGEQPVQDEDMNLHEEPVEDEERSLSSISQNLRQWTIVCTYMQMRTSISQCCWVKGLQLKTGCPIEDYFKLQADRAYGTEISPRLFVVSFVILLYTISYNICI